MFFYGRWSLCCFLILMVIYWSPAIATSDLLVKSCVYVKSIKNLENKGKSTVYVKIWRDNDVSTAQQTSAKAYNSALIDFSDESPICWSFSTSSITDLMWRPDYAIKATIQVNGDQEQGLLLVSFPYNITSVFQSYTDKALTRVSTGTITFDIYHTFSGSWMKISNRNFMVYKTCYKLWSVCVESPKQGNHSQCISNAVSSTSPTGGQTALNDQNPHTVWSPAISSSTIPDRCWQPYSQYVKINIANSFGLIRIGFAEFNGFSSRSWQSSDTYPGKYFSFSFTNDTTDEVQNWQYWYADLSNSTFFSQDITSPANSTYPYYIINPLFLRKDVNPYPAGKNRLTEVISGFNEYWVVNTNLSYNANYGVFTTWGSLLVINSQSNDNNAQHGRDIGKATCNGMLTDTGVLVQQLASTSSQRCYDTGVASQCTGPVYYPPMALAYTDGSLQVTCGSNEDLKNCAGISSCVTSTLGANQWCDNTAVKADDYRPIYIECKVPTQTHTSHPSKSPTFSPTLKPTLHPSRHPTESPSVNPTESPTRHPTKAPTPRPTKLPTLRPTRKPTTMSPTEAPIVGTKMPTLPTSIPSQAPTIFPTVLPTAAPTALPTSRPTHIPTRPTSPPTSAPTLKPTTSPSSAPTTTTTTLIVTTSNEAKNDDALLGVSRSWIYIIAGLALLLICGLLCLLLFCCYQRRQKKAQQPDQKAGKFDVEDVEPRTKATSPKKGATDETGGATDGQLKRNNTLSYPLEDIEESDSDLYRGNQTKDGGAHRDTILSSDKEGAVPRQPTQTEGTEEGDPAVTGSTQTPQTPPPQDKESIGAKIRNGSKRLLQRNKSDPVPDEDDDIMLEMQDKVTPNNGDSQVLNVLMHGREDVKKELEINENAGNDDEHMDPDYETPQGKTVNKAEEILAESKPKQANNIKKNQKAKMDALELELAIGYGKEEEKEQDNDKAPKRTDRLSDASLAHGDTLMGFANSQGENN